MVHSSTHLAFCWHFQQVWEDSLLLKTKDGEQDSSEFCGSSKKNRRQKYKEQGGPSRESLQRSHIVSILRQIPAIPGLVSFAESEVELRHHGNWKTEEEELPVDVLWPLSAVAELGEEEVLRVDWNVIPASADPLRGFGYKAPAATEGKRSSRKQAHEGGHYCHVDDRGEGKLVRGSRKRSQVESVATALKLLNLPAGSVVVDFGSGSGALSLPLACLFKEFTFVCVDYKQESLRLLDLRAQAASLNNLTSWQGRRHCIARSYVEEEAWEALAQKLTHHRAIGRIEDFMEPFDACVALHACGHATDIALMQALRWRAGYVVSPCCVGKLRFAVGSPSLIKSSHDNNTYTPESLRTATATLNGYVFPNLFNSNSASVHLSTSETTDKQLILLRQSSGVADYCLTYPRSQWLRSVITIDDFLLLARTADWSSYDYGSQTSRLHSLCKVIVELDRNQASHELGYRSSLLALADQMAGAVGVSHILVGKPP